MVPESTTGSAAGGARPSVSLVMPNRNNEAVLDLVLARLAETTTHPDVELIVVDDGSTDSSREILRRFQASGRFGGELSVIEREHSGVVVTLNAGLAAASGELVVQLDGDATIETRGWLERMVGFFASDDRIGTVCAKVVIDGRRTHAYGVNAVSPAGLHDRGTQIVEPAGERRWHFRVRRPLDAKADPLLRDHAAEVDACIGVCMMYRRAAALELGGYDEGFQPVWFDDLDLSLSHRARLGLKNFYFPGVLVDHRLAMRARTAPLPRRAAAGVRRVVARALPERTRERLTTRFELDRPTAEHAQRLRHHYDYWRSKWGWDPLNPAMDAILRRWGATEICWAFDDARREAGEAIAGGSAPRTTAVPDR